MCTTGYISFKGTSFSMCYIGSSEVCRVLSFFLVTSPCSTFTSNEAAEGLFVCCCAFKVYSPAGATLAVFSVASWLGALFEPPDSKMS